MEWLRCTIFQGLRLLGAVTIGFWLPVRSMGAGALPTDRPLLILANHQSFFDPVLLGLTLSRPPSFLARTTLFRFAPFRWLISFMGAIPIDRDGLGKEGLRQGLDRLQRGQSLVVFPEGTRTPDGNLSVLKPGVLLLIRKSEAQVVLAGIAGVYEIWPRRQRFPRPGPVAVSFRTWKGSTDDAVAALASLTQELQTAMDEAGKLNQVRRLADIFQGRRH